mmetsp:Transcript_25336/g.63549  ORF Transcript_25336/g.63549 Transcript_25336/m.63549 type:complete len:122 (+) Transcript_25336:1-366(+)
MLEEAAATVTIRSVRVAGSCAVLLNDAHFLPFFDPDPFLAEKFAHFTVAAALLEHREDYLRLTALYGQPKGGAEAAADSAQPTNQIKRRTPDHNAPGDDDGVPLAGEGAPAVDEEMDMDLD